MVFFQRYVFRRRFAIHWPGISPSRAAGEDAHYQGRTEQIVEACPLPPRDACPQGVLTGAAQMGSLWPFHAHRQANPIVPRWQICTVGGRGRGKVLS